MPKYDLENLLSDLQGLFSANLNTKISSINSEKNDSIVLAQIDSNAYFLQMLDGKEANYNPFILYGIHEITTVAIRGASEDQLKISVVLVVEDQGQDINITTRMFRYSRALKETLEENYQLIQNSVSLKIQSLVPVQFEAINTSNPYRAIGLLVTASLA